MKKLFFCVLLLTTTALVAEAQTVPAPSMRGIVVSTLMDLGVKLYDRHDYTEATAVFNRVLSYDPSHPDALKYLSKINPNSIKPVYSQRIERKVEFAPVQTVRIPSNTPALAPLNDDATIKELQDRIAIKTKEINKLKAEISALPTQSVGQVSSQPVVDVTDFNANLDSLHQELGQLRQAVDSKNQSMDLSR